MQRSWLHFVARWQKSTSPSDIKIPKWLGYIGCEKKLSDLSVFKNLLLNYLSLCIVYIPLFSTVCLGPKMTSQESEEYSVTKDMLKVYKDGRGEKLF